MTDHFEYNVHSKRDKKNYLQSEKKDIIRELVVYLSILAVVLGICMFIKDLFFK